VARLGVLADPVRRRLYRYVVGSGDAVSRDQAAEGVEVPRHTARFHLDKLVDEGLLVAEFRRLTGRTGPGAGRPAKVYRRAAKASALGLAGRGHDLAAQLLADAVERAVGGTQMVDAVRQAAEHLTRSLAGGKALAEWSLTERITQAESLERIADVLRELATRLRAEVAPQPG